MVSFKLRGALREGTTATDLVLTITERLRDYGVVGTFVEFFGPGLGSLSLADRATLGNMSPEYGSTVAICPIDGMTLDYLRLTGRPAEQVDLVEAYARTQGLFASDDDDGLLTASEVATLKLDADWAILSACNTAAPDGRPGARPCLLA